MHLTVFWGFALLLWSHGAVSQGRKECQPGQVHCQDTGSCVPRFEFRCGNRGCGGNKTLCGPPSGHPLECAPGNGCPDRSGSLPSGEGDIDGAVRQCSPGQVHCQASGACVPRFEFQCGNRVCGVNKSLCGPPSGDPLDCAPGKECPGRNGSLPSGEGDKDGEVNQDRMECPHGQVHCQSSGACVPRFEFQCGNRGCGVNKTLCGPPSGDPLDCALGKGCHDRNGSLPSGEGDKDGNNYYPEDDGVRSHMPREDSNDDNPFLSRWFQRGEHDFDRSDLRRVLNDTGLRRMLRQSFNRSIFEEINDHGSLDDRDDPHRDGCDKRYTPCIKNALKNVMLLKALDGQCCRMRENPLRFTLGLRNFTRQFHCPRGTKFCPFRFVIRGNGCIPVERNCSARLGNRSDDRNPSEPHWTPWGSKSRKGYKYCEIFKANIPDKMPCSYPVLIKWMAARNDSVSPFGKACPRGTRFCASTFDCRPKEKGCGTEGLIGWASKILCGSSQRLCVKCGIHCRLKEERCPREANMSMAMREAALKLEPREIGDEALRNLTKSGWAPFCLLRKILLDRVLKELRQCMSREAHCRENGYEEHKNCVAGEEFCQKLVSFVRPFSTGSHHRCHGLKTDPVKFEEKIRSNWTKKPWGGECRDGHVFCPTSMRCVPKDRLSECTVDEQFCKAGLARPPWKMNHSKEAGGRFCCLFMSSAPNGSCSFRVMLDWLSRKDKSCSPFGQCCPGSQNFSLSQMRCVNPEERGNRKLDVNDTKCEDDDHVFCERLHVCLPKHANCTKPERFNFFSVSKFANQSGWAALCQVLVPFNARLDYGLRKCRQFLNRPNGTCRGKISCSEREEFCRRVGRCVPKGNCSNHPKPTDRSPPTPTPATTHSPLCHPMDPELRMLWAREPLRRLFAPNQEVLGLVGLLPPREVGAELQFKLEQGDWKDFKGCGRGQMRIVSIESTLRLSSCAHGFASFDITSSPDGSAHGQCVNIPDSPQFKETVAMALLPNLDHCAAGLDIAVTRRNITTKEDRPSNTKLFSSYVNVTRNPMNCSVLDVEESLSCRISKAFRLRYRQAVRQLERTELGVVAVGTDPPKSVQLKCFTPQGRLVGIPPGWFLRTDLICGFHPALNAVGRVTVTVAPACKAPAPQAPNFDAVIQEDFRKIYEIFKSLPDLVKNGDPERIIGEIVRLLNAASDAMLKRKIRNFVRSFFEPDRKESCRAPDNCDCSIGTKEAKLNVVIRPVNDRPTLHFARYQNVIFFPPVPENASDIEGKCIDVSVLTKTSQTVIHEYIRGRRGGELFKRMAAGEVLGLGRDPPLVKDADNKRVGLAIREAPDHPKFGVWKYKLSGDGVLRTMNISSGWALLLKPGDCITFCATRGVFWGKETSRDLAFIKVRGWDCSNNLTSGYHRLNDSFMDSQTAFSLDAAKCVVLKLGCDNVAGSELERDRCGLCLTRERDRNKCVGCDGIAYSNKKKDECGNCVGRGEKSPYCSRSCRKPSYFDECGVCQINGSETPTTRDCNGDCHGSAKRSCNNICVGGKTGRPLNLGEDLCGKCGGKNECVDCAGEIHGKKRLDSCQRCLDPEDQLFNRCPKIIDVDVRAVIGNESTKLCVTVAGMKDSITCYLEGGDGSRYTLNFIEAKSKRKVILATPVGIPPGEYALNCTLDDIPNKIGFKEKIIVYRKPRIIEVSPNETMINTATNVTLTGEKFFNTAALQCVFFMENGKFLKVKATFVSAITIVCPLPPHARSQHGFISVMFNAKSEDLAKAMKRRFSIYELVPEPTSCKFSEKRNYLEILFSRPVECGNRKWESCSRYFNAVARSNLTEVSKCRCREGKLLVQVASGSRLRPGQTVGVLLRTIKPLRWGYTKYPSEEEQLIVQDSANPVEFTIKLSAPEEVGLCDSFTVSVETNQRAAMNWSAAFDNPSSATPAQSADLEQLNDRLANVSSKQRRVRFSARDFEVGVLYNITVCGLEEFSGQEDCDTVAIRRVGKTVPKIIFPASRIVIGPSIRVKFRAKVQPPSCVARNKRFMVYLWSCDVKGLEFDDENPSLRIGADQLTAGQVLKCTFTAYIRGDDSLRARAKLTIVVKKKNVVAKIKGGQQRTIGAHEEAVCDGGVSYDPNNLAGDPIYLWTCECKYDDGWKSCIHRNKTTGHLKAVILPNERVVRIPPDTFPANKICAVKLRYFKDDMNASTSVYFNVKAHEVPFVKIVKVFYDDAKIKFIAVVRSPLPDLKIEWSCKQVDEEGNLLDFDLERLAVVRTSLIVKKRPNKLVIKRRVALVFRRLEDGLNVKCKCKVSREEVEAFAEEEMKVDVPPIEGKCHELERSEDGRISIEAVDFEDPASEVLKYRVGYLSREGKPQFTTSWSIISAWENLDLPSGDPDNGDVLKCVVLARNTRGATTRTVCPVVVPPQNFSKEEIKNTTDEISEKLNQNKIAEVQASVKKMLSGSNDKEANEEMLSELTKQMADQFKAIVENEDELEDREDINENLETLKLGLYGEEDENEQSREDVGKRAQAAGDVEELAKNVRKMASPQRKESDGLARRRRRAADGDNGEEEGEEVEAKTPDEVETILSIFDALIQASNYSNTTVKQELVLLVDDLGRGLCQSLSTGEPALVAESHIVVIRSEKNSFDTVDVNFTNTACENCSYTVQASAQVLLGQSLKGRYETWDCDEDGCNGACIVSAQYPYDLLAVSNNESSISDVVYVKLFNPENAAPLSANGLAEPATFRIPLRSYNASNDNVAMCHAWDESSLSWKIDGVTTTVIPDNGNGGVSVDCKASSLGFVTVLAVDSSVLPLQSSTTQSPTVSTQHVAPENEVHIQFKLVGNYEDVITDSSKPEFISRVTQAIADAMGVQTSRLTNVDARPGSILVSFTLLPGGPGENNVSTAVSVLRELVTSGNFSVSLADGRTLVADSVSFQSSANPFSPVTSLSPAPTTQEEEEPSETSSKLNTGALFGIIVGSIVGVTLLIASVILFANMRSRFSKVDYASGKEKEIKPAFSPTSAHDNKVVYEELPKDEKKINSYPMVNLREEAEIPLPGTPCYPEDEKKCD